MLTATISTFYLLLIIALVINLILTGDRPTKTMAWILVVIFIPVIGIILYVTFGVNRRHFKFSNLKSARAAKAHLQKADEFFKDIRDDSSKLNNTDETLRYIEKLNTGLEGFLATKGNKINLLVDGKMTFDTIFSELEKAKTYIHIQYYIFENGILADRFSDILIEKAKSGVEVRLMYDGVGSMVLDKGYLQKLRDAGVKTQSYFPLYISRVFKWQINYRNHRKIVVVDGRVGFTGGINVSDKYIVEEDDLGKWHDYHLRLEGPAVWSLNTVFTIDWYFATKSDEVLSSKYFPKPSSAGSQIAQIISSGPDSHLPTIQHQYLSMIHAARKYIYIINPYIIPDSSVLTALKMSALSGVDVKILFPQKSDSRFVNWSMRSYLEELLAVGVKIIQFLPRFLHGKVMIVDDQIVSVGTANLDIRSFFQNYEVNAMVYDSTFASEVKEVFLRACKSGKELKMDDFETLTFLDRLKFNACRIFSPLL